jgi:hypothetical protein
MLRDPTGLRPPPVGWEKLQEELLELGVELGILAPAQWMTVGDSCGKTICQSGGPGSSRSLNLIDTIQDLCIKGLTVGDTGFAIEVKTKCEDRCEKYIKRMCPNKAQACPFMDAASL